MLRVAELVDKSVKSEALRSLLVRQPLTYNLAYSHRHDYLRHLHCSQSPTTWASSLYSKPLLITSRTAKSRVCTQVTLGFPRNDSPVQPNNITANRTANLQNTILPPMPTIARLNVFITKRLQRRINPGAMTLSICRGH
jgi:hypothetical protein